MSAEQSAGVGQVSKAMGTVDQVTQRNASGAEELSSTAEEMAAQAEGLQRLVGFFLLADQGMGSARLQGHAPQAIPDAAAAHPATMAKPAARKAKGASAQGGFKEP